MDLQEAGCEGMDWIELAQDGGRWQALVNEPSGCIKFEKFLDQLKTGQLLKKDSATCSK